MRCDRDVVYFMKTPHGHFISNMNLEINISLDSRDFFKYFCYKLNYSVSVAACNELAIYYYDLCSLVSVFQNAVIK